MLVDGGSNSNILFGDAFWRMGIREEEIRPIKTSLHAFNGAEVKPLRVIVLPVYATNRIVEVKVLVVNTSSAMNVIMGSKWIHVVQAVVSTLYRVMRCQSPDGFYATDIKGDQSQNQRCYST